MAHFAQDDLRSRNNLGDNAMLDRSAWTLPPEDKASFLGLMLRAQLAMKAAAENNAAALGIVTDNICKEYLRKRGSIRSANISAGPEGQPVVDAMFWYRPRTYSGVTKPRVFDPLFFIAMMVMEWGGGRFRFHPTKRNDKEYLNLRYEHPKYHHGGFRMYLARIIADTPPTKQTPFADDHHSYRYLDLHQQRPDTGLPKPEHGRARALEVARELYEDRLLPPVDTVRPDEFASLLTQLFTAATLYHSQEGR